MTPRLPRPFVFGDRVKLITQGTADACVHGVIVYWKGTYSRKTPRVRWASGWGTSVFASNLVKLTPEECVSFGPSPELCEEYGDTRVGRGTR